jgi:pimeloyl-ACP methyl ester carboxylesterase
MWQPVDKDRQNSVIPCVIYMHGNSSSRMEALSALSLVLSLGASLLSFDFSGSGKSEGEYVSLGSFEKDDLQCVVEYLRTTGKTSTIALWGRSMGAATALLHGERDPSIVSTRNTLKDKCIEYQNTKFYITYSTIEFIGPFCGCCFKFLIGMYFLSFF